MRKSAVNIGTNRISIEQMHSDDLYTRWRVEGSAPRIRGQLFRLAREKVSMGVSVLDEVLDVDFSVCSTRPDVEGPEHVDRPGYFVSQVARVLKDCLGNVLVTNGNNIGYWGNQFLLCKGHLVHKTVPPLFYDPGEDVSGQRSFICQTTDGRICMRYIKIVVKKRTSAAGMATVAMPDEDVSDIAAAVSGYPLLVDGVSVWRDHVEQAWDPKLLYSVGEVAGLRRCEILQRLLRANSDNRALERHALTVYGTDDKQDVYVLVTTESGRGIVGSTIDEAGEIMQHLGVRECVVLGAKGDAQVASAAEGVLSQPLVSAHDRDVARAVDRFGACRSNEVEPWCERPVPSIVVFAVRPDIR